MRMPLLEDCRVFLHKWAVKVKDPYYKTTFKGRTFYMWFDESGSLVIYKLISFKYVYEGPCLLDQYSQITDHANYTNLTRGFVNYENCTRLTEYLLNKSSFIHTGPHGPFCYFYGNTHDFPLPMKVSSTLWKNMPPIHASKFYVNTKTGKVYKSPNLASYAKFVREDSPYLNKGASNLDYVYDYWDDESDF